MRWVFESATSSGLKVVPELPDVSPCLLEGRNGVGKTVAVQLLQLVSGDVPHEFLGRPELWRSLRDRLGNTTITGSGLDGADVVKVQFTPDRWPDQPTAGLDHDALGTVTIDGRVSTMGEVSNLLRVDRISGNEDLASSVRIHLQQIEDQLAAVASRIRAREEAVRLELDGIVADLESSDPHAVAGLMKQVRDLVESREDAKTEASLIAQRLGDAQKVVELIYRRESLDAEVSELSDRSAEARKAVDDAEAALAAAQKFADELAQRFADEGGLAKELADASKLLRTRQDRTARLKVQAARLAQSLGLSVDPAETNDALDDTLRMIDEIDARVKTLDSTVQVKSVVDAILPALESFPNELNDQLLGEGFSPDLTVGAARTAIEQRRSQLAGEPQPDQVRALIDTKRRLVRRHASLESLVKTIADLVRAQTLEAAAARESQDLEARSEEHSEQVAKSRQADEEVGRLQHLLAAAHEELADVTSKLAAKGTLSRDDAESEIAETLQRLSLAERDVEAAIADYLEQLTQADARVVAAEQALATARTRAAVAQTETAELAARLGRQLWLADVVTQRPLLDAEGVVDAEVFAEVRRAILTAWHAIGDTREVVERLQGLAKDFLDSASDRSSPLARSSQDLWDPFAQMLSQRILEALNSAAIRHRVFGDAQATRFDATSNTLTLDHGDGRVDERPLSSFSAGEQAFAFTQARILDLPAADQPNRLLVLDEFGAFVSADRLPDLATFLRSEAVRDVASQVLVILPLQVDYAAEIGDTSGNLRKTYERRLDQINARGYYTEELA